VHRNACAAGQSAGSFGKEGKKIYRSSLFMSGPETTRCETAQTPRHRGSAAMQRARDMVRQGNRGGTASKGPVGQHVNQHPSGAFSVGAQLRPWHRPRRGVGVDPSGPLPTGDLSAGRRDGCGAIRASEPLTPRTPLGHGFRFVEDLFRSPALTTASKAGRQLSEKRQRP
jgi:hypothetical protein